MANLAIHDFTGQEQNVSPCRKWCNSKVQQPPSRRAGELPFCALDHRTEGCMASRIVLRHRVGPAKRPATVSPLTIPVGRRYQELPAWEGALSRSLRIALEAVLVLRPGSGTLTLEW